MNDFKISVIIPTYNSATTIKRAINSVIQQTLSPCEIIVVDDCSDDNTSEVLKSIQSQIKLIIIQNEKNSGPSYSRNRGIQISRGDWIAFLDSDDYWHPEKLKLQVEILQRTNAMMIGGMAQVNKDQEAEYREQDIKIMNVTPGNMLWKNHFQTPTVLVKKNPHLFFKEDMSYSEDFELWTRLIKEFGCAICIAPALCYLGKEAFIVSGLSSNLIKMQRGELLVLKEERNLVLRYIAITFSFIKFFRRLGFKIIGRRP